VAPVCDELGLNHENTIAYICGNPDMILSAEETLVGRGFPPEQVKKELYWPKGKAPAGAPPATVASDE
jgi:ferredoxin-NADP reductase